MKHFSDMFRRGRKENKAKLEHKLYLARESPEPIFDISGCDLRQVPAGIYSLCRVFLKEHLDMSNNAIPSLCGGGQLQDLHVLRKLSLVNNAFTSLPDEIQLLINLRELYVQNNHIKKLPSSLCTLSNLRVLDASDNSLRELPPELGRLCCLERLNVARNVKLRELPRSVCRMRLLSELELDGDNYVYPPAEILAQGVDATMKFICDDNDYEYIPASESKTETDGETYGNFEAKIWELAKIKEERTRAFLEIERQNELLQRQELEMANSNKLNKDKLLADLVVQQNKLDETLDKIQQTKDAERFRLIEQVKDAENNADVAINNLLMMSREPLSQLLEQENLEQERIIAAANKYNENLCKTEILEAMQELLEQETRKFKEFDQFRVQSFQSILAQELQSETNLLDFLHEQEDRNKVLTSKLQEDGDLQKVAVATLLEKSDARSWSLIQQVKLVESQLAALTAIEMDRKKLEMDQHINDLAEKRINLSILLMDLLEQQGMRRSQLLETLKSLEENRDNTEDFWLRQYQQLLDRMPHGLSESQRNMEPALLEILLIAGVLCYLPFLAKWSQNEDLLLNITDEELEEAGIKVPDDRTRILSALHMFRNQKAPPKCEAAVSPSAPPEELTATAPEIEITQSYSTNECVVCMDKKCEIINVPCGHFCSCSECSVSIMECPMCRSPIERKIHVDVS